MTATPASAAKLRELDRHTWLATLLMAEPARNIATVLLAFHAEVSSVAWKVREPMAREIRLQWWADCLNGLREGEAQANPLSAELLNCIATNNLPATALVDKVQAHSADLYSDPPANRHTFEQYAGETRSILFQLIAMAVNGERASQLTEICGHGGVVATIRDTLMNLDADLTAGRCCVPADILVACGTNGEAVFTVDDVQRKAIRVALAAYGDEHLLKFSEALAKAEGADPLFFLPLANARGVFTQAADGIASASGRGLKAQWTLWRTARSGRY